jgi:hypothetical protein
LVGVDVEGDEMAVDMRLVEQLGHDFGVMRTIRCQLFASRDDGFRRELLWSTQEHFQLRSSGFTVGDLQVLVRHMRKQGRHHALDAEAALSNWTII